jgi:GR25 family glycosyltransferase involved in LPS biosynthesis
MDFFKAGIYVINLDRRPERYNDFCKRLQFNKDLVKRVSAVDGLTNIIPKNLFIRNKFAYACRLSHIKIMKEIINNNEIKDEDYALIFEDDAFFVNQFNKLFEEYITQIKKLDNEENLIYIGGRFEEEFDIPNEIKDVLFEKKDENLYLKKRNIVRNIGADFWRDRTTNVLIYNKKACKKIVEIAERTNQDTEIDTFLNWIYHKDNKMKIYDLLPHLVYSPINYLTDIQEKK